MGFKAAMNENQVAVLALLLFSTHTWGLMLQMIWGNLRVEETKHVLEVARRK